VEDCQLLPTMERQVSFDEMGAAEVTIEARFPRCLRAVRGRLISLASFHVIVDQRLSIASPNGLGGPVLPC
jgi:hypothetical protein